MNNGLHYLSLEKRISELETNEGKRTAELSAVQREIRELRVWQADMFADLRETLRRIEDRVEDRPRRSEVMGLAALQSHAPRIEIIKGPGGTRLSVARVPPWALVIILVCVALVILAWILTR